MTGEILHRKFWRDAKIKRLSKAEKCLVVYLLTGPQVNRVGYYFLSPALACEDLSGAANDAYLEEFWRELDIVCQLLGWQFDKVSSVVFIPHWWRYHKIMNVNHAKACAADLAEVPASELIDDFVSCSAKWGYTFTLNPDPRANRPWYCGIPQGRVSDTVADTVADTLPERSPKQRTENGVLRTENRDLRSPPPPNTAQMETAPPIGQEGGGGEEEILEVYEKWNKMAADRSEIAACRSLTPTRRKRIGERLRDPAWREAWREAIARVPLDRPDWDWRPTFDWLVANDTNAHKLLEGAYDRNGDGLEF